MTKKITNTTREIAERPEIAMLELMTGVRTGSIERSEARGQAELVAAAVLPTNGIQRPEERKTWEAMGIVIGDPVAGDAIFTNVTLPAGWAKRPTDHSMWSELVDAKCRVRARIFYKAAFYDRSARITPVTRFTISRDYDRSDHSEVIHFRVLDCEQVAFSGVERKIVGADGKRVAWELQDEAERLAIDECKAWLSENGYPDFSNPAAYWDAVRSVRS